MKSAIKKHHYTTNISWTGNSGSGTSNYSSYKRSYQISIKGKPKIEGSSDPAFKGDSSKYNPEELFLASISSCHMLWYLHLCSMSDVVVLEYNDGAVGVMIENKGGSGKFESVTLNPAVIVQDKSMIEIATKLHAQANEKCFIANSCNFEIRHEAKVIVKENKIDSNDL